MPAGFTVTLMARGGTALRPLLPVILCVCAGFAATPPATPFGPDALRERFAALRAQPEPSPFGPLLYLQSHETPNRLRGDVHALVDHPHTEVQHALSRAEHWCQILILHLNVKYCRVNEGTPPVLEVGLGRKYDRPLSAAHWVRFSFRVVQADDDYLRVVLSAPTGPMGTRDYLIAVEVAPFDAGHSVVHMTYTYSYDTAARLAMQTYLATLGRDKVGFSVVGRQRSGAPQYVEGVRGVIERNIMRYYLAIDAFLGAQQLPEARLYEKSTQDWYDATERYARQLHEMERPAYLKMKASEIQRQQSGPPPRR